MPGYVTDTPYANTFFRELSPAWLNYVAALGGVAPRDLERPFAYLELGCGFGSSAVMNAAAFPHATVHACDFNADHVDGGRRYAETLGVENIHFHATAFADLLADPGLPPFDFIVLHGVYSWVDASTRGTIRELIARLLLPGGLAYVSYNTLPGWANELPLRKLLVELAATAGGNAAQKAEAAARRVESLSASGFRYFAANPGAQSAVEAYRRGEGEYLAHEFMNEAWEPFYAIDVIDELAGVGLLPAASATLAQNHLPLIMDAAAAQAIASLESPRQQHLALDFAVNQRFRRDVFVRPDGSPVGSQRLDDAVIGCAVDADAIGVTARVPRGEIRFQEPFIADVRRMMGEGAWRFADAVAALARSGEGTVGIARNLLFLVASGVLAPFAHVRRSPALPTRIAGPVIERALEDAARPDGHPVVPAPVYGNGVEIRQAEAQAILQWARGASTPGVTDGRLRTLARVGVLA